MQKTAFQQAQDEQKKADKALDEFKKAHEKDGDLTA